MKIVLIHPPLDDPTIPYHATAYLAGHLRANGFNDVVMRDVNVEYVDDAVKPDAVQWVYAEIEKRLENFRQASELTYVEQEEYYRLLARQRFSPAEITEAVATLRTKDKFLDYPSYWKGVNTVVAYMGALGALCYPADQWGFQQAMVGHFSVASMNDLFDESLSDRVCFPFKRYFHQNIVSDPDFHGGDLFAISVVYDHQLFHAFHFARLLKKQWPSKKVVFGGTAITQMYKYMIDKNGMRELFRYCDAVVVGEGETAICEIAAAGGEFAGRRFANTITYSAQEDKLDFPDMVRYENVSGLGTPIYDHPWHLYLSPERGVNYSPTRGCYWNRCTFCDYGLNTDKPTSPWRERTIPQVISDLKKATAEFGINYVYFAVDVMAPGYLERLSDAIVDAGLNIKWAAELRMEKIFSVERAHKMSKAGCVCVSFGMESGNQRILDLMDKGTKLDYMAATMKNFASAGIACQIMAFTDFPTETPEEREATVEFVRNNRDYWSAGGVGSFLLTGTSLLAKNPEKYGISLVETKDVDVRRKVAYRVDGETGQRMTLTEESDSSFDDRRGIFPDVLYRPWAGGTDSLHTMLYFDTYGRDFFKSTNLRQVTEVDGMTDEETRKLSVALNGNLVECRFDLGDVMKNLGLFPLYLQDRVSIPAEPTLGSFKEWAQSARVAVSQNEISHWIVLEDKCGRLNKVVYKLLLLASRKPVAVSDILARVPEEMRQRVLTYLTGLESNGFISFKDGDRVIKNAATAAPSWSQRFRPGPQGKMPPLPDENVGATVSDMGSD